MSVKDVRNARDLLRVVGDHLDQALSLQDQLSTALELQESFDRLLQPGLRLLEACGVMVHVAGTGPAPIERVYARGFSDSFLKALAADPSALPIVEVMESGRTLYIEDANRAPELHTARELFGQNQLGSLVIVPLMVRVDILGTLTLAWPQPRSFDDQVRPWVRVLADQTAVTLALTREHRRAREAQLRYQSLFEGVPVGLFRVTAEGKLLDGNTALTEMLGYPNRLVLMSTDARSLLVDPGAWDRATTMLEEEGELRNLELRVRRYDGSVIWVRIIARAVRDATGKLRYLEGTLEDITEQKRVEQERGRLLNQIRLIIDTVPEGMILLGEDRRILMANPRAREYLEVLTETDADAPLDRLGDRPFEAFLEPRPEGLARHEIKVHGERQRIFEVETAPLHEGERPGGWVVVLRDVTRDREIRQSVETQERLAAVGQLAAGIAHDFNNLLQGIMGYAELYMLQEDLPPALHEALKMIYTQGERATQLIQQVLDFARQTVRERRPMDLVPFLKEFEKFIRRTIPENIRIRMEYEPGSYVARVNPAQLQQVLSNLVVNARDAMPHGGELKIRIYRWKRDAGQPAPFPNMRPGDWICVAVSDTGTGIPNEVLPRVFEPFFTTKERGKGTGLGLAQVYGIVKQHEGYIDVQSRVGQGTTFTIYLPAEEAAVPRGEPLAVRMPMGQGQTVLLVEDDATVREVGRMMLEAMGYRVVTAIDGVEALDRFREVEGDVDLVLCDVVMPRMGGVELLKELRKKKPDLKMVVTSGYPLSDEVRHLLGPGRVVWLPKPFGIEHLAEALENATSDTAGAG